VNPQQTRCPVTWCGSVHDDGDFSMHNSIGQEFPATLDPMYTGIQRRETLCAGLDQPKPYGDVMVSLSGSFGEMWLTREQAKRLAIRLMQLDLDANGADGA